MINSKTESDPLSVDTGKVEKSLINFIKNETESAGLSKAVIGLSGGVDSAVSCALAAGALGPANVLAVIMPYKASSPRSLRDAEEVIKITGVRSEIVDISRMSDQFLEQAADADNIRKGNVFARMRMIVLYDRSAREQALVIGTSNKSEILLGYGTMHGDLACAINPLGNLYKTQIWDLARHLGIPGSVIEKAPTADLWEGQTDEGEMGLKYREVDKLLYHMTDENKSVDELIIMGFDESYIMRVRGMIEKSEFKRRMPRVAGISGT